MKPLRHVERNPFIQLRRFFAPRPVDFALECTRFLPAKNSHRKVFVSIGLFIVRCVPMEPKSILVVDDDEILRGRLEKAFAKRGWEVYVADGFDAAVKIATVYQPDRAVLDLKMPGRSGLEILRDIRSASPKTRCVILTGYGSITNAVEAVKLGAVGYVTKPADADQVLSAFEENKNGTPTPEFPPPSLAEAQWEHIQRVLADSGGNISEAARRLDIPRRTLQRKLKKNAP